MKKTNNIKFGDRVGFTQVLHRKREYNRDSLGINRRVRNWRANNCHYISNTGIVIGVRTLANGYVYNEEGTTIFVPTQYIKAYLVAINMQLKPILIPFDNISLIT